MSVFQYPIKINLSALISRLEDSAGGGKYLFLAERLGTLLWKIYGHPTTQSVVNRSKLDLLLSEIPQHRTEHSFLVNGGVFHYSAHRNIYLYPFHITTVSPYSQNIRRYYEDSLSLTRLKKTYGDIKRIQSEVAKAVVLKNYDLGCHYISHKNIVVGFDPQEKMDNVTILAPARNASTVTTTNYKEANKLIPLTINGKTYAFPLYHPHPLFYQQTPITHYHEESEIFTTSHLLNELLIHIYPEWNLLKSHFQGI